MSPLSFFLASCSLPPCVMGGCTAEGAADYWPTYYNVTVKHLHRKSSRVLAIFCPPFTRVSANIPRSIVQRIRIWSSKAVLVPNHDEAANQFFVGQGAPYGCQFLYPGPAGEMVFIPFDDCLVGVPAPIRRRAELLAY